MTDPYVLVEPDPAAAAIRTYLRAHPELAKDEYATDGADPLGGLCYPAAEAYYHVRGCELDVYCLSWRDVVPESTGTHWYLRDPDSGVWIDLALSVDDVEFPPFAAGTRRGFITGDTPSKRAQQVLEAVREVA